jgi:hypothetical protein
VHASNVELDAGDMRDTAPVGLISVGSCGAVLCYAGSDKLLCAFIIRNFLNSKIPVTVGKKNILLVWPLFLVVK